MRILIIGAGGQGQVVADAIRFAESENSGISLLGYLDDNPELQDAVFLGRPVLGPVDSWKKYSDSGIILCIGSNQKRSLLYEKILQQGATFASIIHPRALIAHDAVIGAGSYIGAFVIIAAGTVVGCNTIIHGNSVIGHHNVIGDHVHIAPGVNTAGSVKIGTGAMIGIGANVMPGRQIGNWSVVGSATLVHQNVIDRTTVVGVPGKPLKC